MEPPKTPSRDEKEYPEDHVQLSLPFMKDYPPVERSPAGDAVLGKGKADGNPD